jgi:hypothetical protein
MMAENKNPYEDFDKLLEGMSVSDIKRDKKGNLKGFTLTRYPKKKPAKK